MGKVILSDFQQFCLLYIVPCRDFAFPDTNFVKALLAMLSTLRLVAGSKCAMCIWQCDLAGGNVVRSRNTQNQPERVQSELSELTYIKTSLHCN